MVLRHTLRNVQRQLRYPLTRTDGSDVALRNWRVPDLFRDQTAAQARGLRPRVLRSVPRGVRRRVQPPVCGQSVQPLQARERVRRGTCMGAGKGVKLRERFFATVLKLIKNSAGSDFLRGSRSEQTAKRRSRAVVLAVSSADEAR